MQTDIEVYKQKAQEAIESVFNNEYHSSLGIPMPEVQMLLPDDENYATGQYYITIDRTWQIHLNFGKLPVSYKEFTDEVKVLTRHEIEHYMGNPDEGIWLKSFQLQIGELENLILKIHFVALLTEIRKLLE